MSEERQADAAWVREMFNGAGAPESGGDTAGGEGDTTPPESGTPSEGEPNTTPPDDTPSGTGEGEATPAPPQVDNRPDYYEADVPEPEPVFEAQVLRSHLGRKRSSNWLERLTKGPDNG